MQGARPPTVPCSVGTLVWARICGPATWTDRANYSGLLRSLRALAATIGIVLRTFAIMHAAIRYLRHEPIMRFSQNGPNPQWSRTVDRMSGRSVIIASTRAAIRRRISPGSLTVQVFTRRRRPWAFSTSDGVT